MSKRRSSQIRKCPICNMNHLWCICKNISKIHNEVFVTIIMHYREIYLTSNTARLTKNSLVNCEIIQRGKLEKSNNFENLVKENYDNIVLFPDENSIPLNEYLKNNSKINLIVPDGTWTQAKKIKRREPSLKSLPSVHINVDKNITSKYRLRKQSKESNFCTIEAIAFALGELENIKIQEKLLKHLHIFDHNSVIGRNVYLLNHIKKY